MIIITTLLSLEPEHRLRAGTTAVAPSPREPSRSRKARNDERYD
jgi:hypothetical protein